MTLAEFGCTGLLFGLEHARVGPKCTHMLSGAAI